MRETRMEIVAVVTSRLAGCISLGEVARLARERSDCDAFGMGG
jgi:hypothetical protein